MKYLSVIWVLFVISNGLSVKATEKCRGHLTPLIVNRDAEVVDLWHLSWISALDSNIPAATKLELDRKREGKSATQKELDDTLAGTRVHLRQTSSQSGLMYFTIHQDDGTEVFDSSAYIGTASCECSLNGSPLISQPWIIRDAPLGHGFTLKFVSSARNPDSTTSHVEKIYPSQDGKTQVEFRYSITQKPRSPHVSELVLQYALKSFKHVGRHRILDSVNQISIDMNRGQLTGLDMAIWYNLSLIKDEPLFDKVGLRFNGNGKLTQVVGVSQSTLTNSAWSSQRDFLEAVKKGEDEWVVYLPTAPQAALIFNSVYGRKIEDLTRISPSTLADVLDAAKAGRLVPINSFLQFKN
ncbi:MAG: hypothetical protein IPJ71_10970 [Bdellovibrionales bacterium]|nr:hypothetical protein [Bdellovibrionales bacterium]